MSYLTLEAVLMPTTFACIAGSSLDRLQEQGLLEGVEVGRKPTPFGDSEMIYLVEDGAGYYLLPRHGSGGERLSSRHVNHRANLYALKDLGVQCVMSWTAAGAISHNYNMGDLVLVSDLIDWTRQRDNTMFERSPLGVLRQFPVFCPFLRDGMAAVLGEMSREHTDGATLAVTDGPRLETSAEVRMLANAGAQLVAHNFAPEAFLAKELELCFAGLAYTVNYAETGSRYRPFSAAGLFGGFAAGADSERVAHAIQQIGELVPRLAAHVAANAPTCECAETMRYEVKKYNLPDDWRQWFGPLDQPFVGETGRADPLIRRMSSEPARLAPRPTSTRRD